MNFESTNSGFGFKPGLVRLALAIAGAMATTSAMANPSIEELKAQFQSPPPEARPWTWFHVMSGNMTREGITTDLESLAEAGVGGIVLFHVTQGIPHGEVRFNSPEHLDLIAHTAAECERLGLVFTFHNADGWSSTGGPWIAPENSMKRVVWSETFIEGGKVSTKLAQPMTRQDYYRDIAVVAYPALPKEKLDAALSPVFSASDPDFNLAAISDGDESQIVQLDVESGQIGWIGVEYDQPVSIRSLTVFNIRTRNVEATLEVSSDGVTWTKAHDFSKARLGKNEWMIDASFAPVTGRYFRVTADQSFGLAELEFSTLGRIPNRVGHINAAKSFGSSLPESLEQAGDALVDPQQIVDLTAALMPDGTLSADLPEGQWTVMRFGYTTTGAINVNGSPEGTGLEVDKFSSDAFIVHHNAFIQPVIDRARSVAPNALRGVMIDSYEVGGQNWTDDYPALFQERFGESIVPWLVTYAGRLVSSAPETRDMLAAIRALNADLVRDEYYGVFADLMKSQGLESIVQPYGNGPSNDIDVGSVSSLPAGEFWMDRPIVNTNEAVSSARLYGNTIVAAEAFTSFPQVNWRFSPKLGKKWGDLAWISGVNLFMFHRFAHQANTHVMPGMTMNHWGSHFDRTQPWWDKGALPWFTYMARGQHMLRQGLPVADIALFVGEDSPTACPEKTQFGDELPAGTEFDCLNAETLLSRSNFADGTLQLPSGQSYPAIWWREKRAPSQQALARLEEARQAGIIVVMNNEGDVLHDALAKAGFSPRLASMDDSGELPLSTHRRLGDIDIFLLVNFGEEQQTYDLSFDVDGKLPQIWDPETGLISGTAANVDASGRTLMSLALMPGHSRFVVFDRGTQLLSEQIATKAGDRGLMLDLSRSWTLSPDPVYSSLGSVNLPELVDLKEADDPELRYFSGKATYRKTFDWSGTQDGKNERIVLDLGQVESIATVRLNGKELRTLWMPPFEMEIGDALIEGANTLEIEVANLWINRLIGDAALPDTSGFVPAEQVPTNTMPAWYTANEPQPEGPRRTFTTKNFVNPKSELVSSGLIGPVRIVGEVSAPEADGTEIE